MAHMILASFGRGRCSFAGKSAQMGWREFSTVPTRKRKVLFAWSFSSSCMRVSSVSSFAEAPLIWTPIRPGSWWMGLVLGARYSGLILAARLTASSIRR